MIYCITCKKKTDTLNTVKKFSKNSRNMKQGICQVRNAMKNRRSIFINKTKNKSKEEVEEILNKLYYNPGTVCCGITELKESLSISYVVVKDFVALQDTCAKHTPTKYIYPCYRVIANGIDYQFQTDLDKVIAYEKENKGYRYLSPCIDIFS